MITLEETISTVQMCRHVADKDICPSCPYRIYGGACMARLRDDVVRYLNLLVL